MSKEEIAMFTPSMRTLSPRRSFMAALLAAGLVATGASGAAAAKGSTFDVSACRTSDLLQITVTWDGILADYVGFGAGQHHGGGLGAVEPLTGPMLSGSLSETLPALTTDKNGNTVEMDIAGGNLFLTGGALPTKSTEVATKTLQRPHGGWAACS